MTDPATSVARDTLLAPGGHYPTWRAEQLSGVPERALEKWVRRGVLVPDFSGLPRSWTYRDLVFARMLAWLLNEGAAPWEAAQSVSLVKQAATPGADGDPSSGSPDTASADGGESTDGSDQELPDPASFLGEFTLATSSRAKELGKRDLWGPDLVHPSPRTSIDPSIERGEPCVRDTTIQTRALLALHTERGIDAAGITAVYEELDLEDVLDALALEGRLRG